MNSKATRNHSNYEEASATFTDQNAVADLGQRPFALCAKMASVMFHGSEDMRKVQQQVAHMASERYDAIAKQLCEPCELAAMPARQMRMQLQMQQHHLQGAADYWHQLAATGLRTQYELVSCLTQLIDVQANGELTPSLETWSKSVSETLSNATRAFQPALEAFNRNMSESMAGALKH